MVVTWQLAALRHATAASPEQLPEWSRVLAANGGARALPPLEGLHGGASPTGTPNRCWLSLDLLATLCRLGAAGHIGGVRQVLELPRQHCPEVLLCALASCGAEWGALQEEVAGTLLLPYLGNHPNAAVVLRRLWVANAKCVLLGMVELHAKEPACVARLLDVCQELQVSTRKTYSPLDIAQ